MIKITVFTKNNCNDCMKLKMMLDNFPSDVATLDVIYFNVEKPENAHFIEAYDLMTMPSLIIENEPVIHGFQEGKVMTRLGV
ncbi:glutaredoxin family protein [Bacillus paranthracis]|uniref:glutaredoxin family protein n=1 Tax=Bacillus paranthracis TaxID=2026186 RepID=UPI00215737AA|nr:thioredoxin family protein [Bacillus paranthracis]MCR6795726.1 thioredoxin family protein [Bacillus paranthracis]MCR6795795.1 thioredoxin family protein [Bacillus paranthracis]MED1165968.1 thioredoxin family protein [Bacillus paranthracis]